MSPSRINNHPFWGTHAPLSTLTGAGLIVIASSRSAFALISAGSLVWVYGWTMLVFCAAKPILPKRAKDMVLLFLSGLFGGLYQLILFLISPLLAMETALLVILAPVSCIASSLANRVDALKPEEALVRACVEALALGGVILALSLLREPLGFGALSLPGGSGGIIEFSGGEEKALFPVKIISGSAGALLLFGYGLALFRYVKKSLDGEEEEL